MSDLGTKRGRRETERLLERYARDRRRADAEALVERFTPLARSLAQRYPGGNEREDVLQVAYLGLIKAIDRFDPSRGIAFSSFAVPTILGEIKRYFRDLGWTVRVPRDVQELAARAERATDALTGELGRVATVAEVAARCHATPEQVLEARASVTAHHTVSLDRPARDEDGNAIVDFLDAGDGGVARIEDALMIDQLVAELPEREQRIVRLRFGDELMQREIAQRLGMSQVQVSRLLAKALATLRSADP